MKNFDSVSQLQRFSLATCITVLQDRVMAHIHVNVATRFSKGNLTLCCNAGRPVMASVDWASSFRTRVQTSGVDCEGDSDREMN